MPNIASITPTFVCLYVFMIKRLTLQQMRIKTYINMHLLCLKHYVEEQTHTSLVLARLQSQCCQSNDDIQGVAVSMLLYTTELII